MRRDLPNETVIRNVQNFENLQHLPARLVHHGASHAACKVAGCSCMHQKSQNGPEFLRGALLVTRTSLRVKLVWCGDETCSSGGLRAGKVSLETLPNWTRANPQPYLVVTFKLGGSYSQVCRKMPASEAQSRHFNQCARSAAQQSHLPAQGLHALASPKCSADQKWLLFSGQNIKI